MRKPKILLGLLVLAGLLVVPAAAFAATDSDTTTVTVAVGSTISVASSGTVNVSVTPTGVGSMSSKKDTVEVSTNNSAGYTLTIADSDSNTDLVDGANTISAHSGTLAVPTSLAKDSWGYHVDSAGGFDTGATEETNQTGGGAYKYAGVPASGSPDTIKSTSAVASQEQTFVFFGANVSTAKPNGNYADTVTYTATTK